MKKLVFILIGLLSYSVEAQLYVSNNSYLYNKGAVVYVGGAVELNGTNSLLYLRNEGQLVQGTTGSSVNKGIGKLSVFQEGTVNHFSYNYWCSPVGNASSASGNEDFGITMLNVPTTSTASTPATMITSDSDGQTNPGFLGISTYWIWKFLSSSTYAQWLQSGATTDISAGQGFTMKGSAGADATAVGETAVNNPGSAQRYDFRGKPNDGNITVNVGANNYTLTGNPYPSAMHVNAFLLDAANAACTGVAYYWEQNKTVNSHMLLAYQGGYGAYSPVSLGSNGIYVPATFNTYNIDGTLNAIGVSSGLNIERKYAPIGQGFMVKGSSGGSLTLKNTYRVFAKEGTFSQFEKTASLSAPSTAEPSAGCAVEAIPQIRLNTTVNNQYTTQLALAFVAESTDQVDRGIDALSPVEDSVPNDVYFVLDSNRYVIQGLPFDLDKRIPIGITSAEGGTFTFDASMVLNFDESQPIYLYDAQDGVYHDIKNDTFQATLPAGVTTTRFEITFKNTSLSTATAMASDFVICQNNSAHSLTVSNPKRIEIASVKLFDLNGKLLFDRNHLDVAEHYSFSTAGLSEAIYLVQVTAKENQKVNQKVMITSK
ncbi:MAG: hypothetical protein RL427_884 [Bacteroidota bacterium]